MTITLTCKRCKGTGTIPNEHFEICRALNSEEVKRHFRIHAQAENLENHADDDTMEAVCGEPSTQPCPQCEGEGVLEFDEDKWDLLVTTEKEEEAE